jgi:hypothetical protein
VQKREQGIGMQAIHGAGMLERDPDPDMKEVETRYWHTGRRKATDIQEVGQRYKRKEEGDYHHSGRKTKLLTCR